MRDTQSIWTKAVEIPLRQPLKGDISADVAVIGAGIAGLLTADRLTRKGANVAVLEASRISSGQTKNTTAKITSQHGMIYDALCQRFNDHFAKQYATANQWAIDEYASMIESRAIDCDFERVPAFLYSSASSEPLKREAQVAKSLGIDASFVKDAGLPFPTAGACRFEGQAQFNPLKFLLAVSKDLNIYENTRVLSVEGGRLTTPNGIVTAKSVVFATHFPFINVPGWYFMRMHQERSYVLALKCDWHPQGMYYGVDAGSLSFRQAQGLILASGGSHRTGENSKGGRYDELARRCVGVLGDCREAARWSAQDCVTIDGVPYIGRYAPSAPDWYAATGFAKWGMTSAMIASKIIAGLIMGDPPDWADIFSPSRFKLSASAQSLATETAESLKGLSREFLTLPDETLDALPLGHGGVVEVEGRKVGVYKDEDANTYIVDTRCPHLGCQLEWNPDERSWDCPCHGSRFSFDGSLIDNPAQEGIK